MEYELSLELFFWLSCCLFRQCVTHSHSTNIHTQTSQRGNIAVYISSKKMLFLKSHTKCNVDTSPSFVTVKFYIKLINNNSSVHQTDLNFTRISLLVGCNYFFYHVVVTSFETNRTSRPEWFHDFTENRC